MPVSRKRKLDQLALMSKGSYAVRRSKRRAIYRARRRYRKRLPGIMSRPGIPIGTRARLRYVDNIQMSSASGVMGTHFFRANSIYDPDFTGTGHQPMGRDEMANYFNHYVVVGAKLTVEWLNASADSSSETPTLVGCYTTADTTLTYTDLNSYREAKRGDIKTLQWVFMPTTRAKYSAKKFYNVANVKDNYDRLGAAVGSNPTEGAFFLIACQGIGTGSASLTARVTIDYIVDFSEPKDLGTS